MRVYFLLIAFILSACGSGQTTSKVDTSGGKDTPPKTDPEKPTPNDPVAKMAKAIMENDHSTMRQLIKDRFDLNTKYARRYFVHLATEFANSETLSLLVFYKANPNLVEMDNNRTPLHIAAVHGRLKSLQVLLQYNANVNLVERLGNTPLAIASYSLSPSTEMVQNLLAAKADKTIKNIDGMLPLDLAKIRLNQFLAEPDKYAHEISSYREIIKALGG